MSMSSNARTEGWPLDWEELERRLGFPLPTGVEVREDLDAVYVYANGRLRTMLSASAVSDAVLRQEVRAASQEAVDAIFFGGVP